MPPGSETDAEWRRVLDINLFSALNMIAAARPNMRRGGAIVCISSIAGLAALGAPVAYSAAKAALNAAVKGLARPLAGEGLRINAVAPGNILFPGGTWDRKLAENRAGVEAMLARDVALGRLGAPADIAALTVFLASPRASFITGTVQVVDGGQLRPKMEIHDPVRFPRYLIFPAAQPWSPARAACWASSTPSPWPKSAPRWYSLTLI